ncbi:patatin-like phospholipase family protein [Hyphomicrobium sulfonivorans]|uniref:patatin-like phospholipase family protein n=1 Tax=Hyphomicrobium sulfonivorans TaxID=121290 RepID=UPI00157018F5|nr:patatin-like phospholipase family protein [Hyphomicrobium sulfonivorans]MBI1650716.1 patatin-like phospholipase family protein [Hyphomicrobium sulfonivorans]NSL71926.1 patatin [Hyphomicrobium sulfonivorans]
MFRVIGLTIGLVRARARPIAVACRLPRAGAAALSVAVAVVVVAGCASTSRLPAVPLSLAADAIPLDIPDARFYADTDTDRISKLATRAYQRAKAAGLVGHDGDAYQPHTTRAFLAISGGGDDGAYGAGLLTGWSERGDRPNFAVVTGVSTGALSAPFVFLGSEYDRQLKSMYTETSPGDIFRPRTFMAAVADDAMADSTPLRERIDGYVDQRMVRRLAEEYGKGRILLILTTNLDQGRSVIWNIGAIASSDHPRARMLIVDILLASAAVPGVFPPVMINIAIDGRDYQEMHVDGGAIAQAFLYPPSFNLKAKLKELGVKGARPAAYVIRNGRLYRPEENVDRQTLKIAQQAISTMTASSAVNDIYRMYMTTKRDGVDFKLAYIEDDFGLPYKGPFDRDYMNALFEYGYRVGREGYRWHSTPPNYIEE